MDNEADQVVEGLNPAPYTNFDLPKPKKIKVKHGEAFQVEFDGTFTGTYPNQFNSMPYITLDVKSCYKLEIDGEVVEANTEDGWVSKQVVKTDAGWNPKRTFSFKLKKKAGKAGESSVEVDCGCPIDCDETDNGNGGPPPPPPEETPKFKAEFPLGAGSNGDSLGDLRYTQELGGSNGVGRQHFSLPGSNAEIEVLSAGGNPRQIKVPDGLFDLVEVSGEIEVRIYGPAQIGPKVGGLYTTTGDPVAVHTIAPGDDQVMSGGVRFSVTKGGQTTTREFYGEGDGNGSGVRRSVDENGRITEITTVVVIDPMDPDEWTRTVETRVFYIIEEVEQAVSVRQDHYASRPWGQVLEQTVVDPAGDNLTTVYTYYEDPMDLGYKSRKHVVKPDGSWEKYVYNSAGRLVKVYRPWKDLPGAPDSAIDTNCDLTEFVYSGSMVAEESRTILGTQVSRTASFEQIDSEYDGSSWIDLITVYRSRYHAGEWNSLSTSTSYVGDYSGLTPLRGKLYRTTQENEVATRYTEESGDYNELTGVFTLNSAGVAIRSTEVQGTLYNVAGVANRTTKTVSISDDVGIRKEDTLVCTGSGYETVSSTTYEYEASGERRLTSITKDGAVVSSYSYTSPTVQVVTDAFGVQTTITKDGMGNIVESVKAGVSAGTNYEAQPAITTTNTSVGRTRSTVVSAGALSLTSTSVSDLTQREVSRTDEQGRTVTTSYASGGRVVTETRPGSVTRVATYYLDGQLKSVTGTGVIPEFHDYTLDGEANVVHTVYFGTGDDTSQRWRKTVTNGLGQVVQEISPGPNVSDLEVVHEFDNFGQRTRTVRPGMTPMLYEYDLLGQLMRQGLDMDSNGFLEDVSSDTVTETLGYFQKDGNDDWWQVVEQRQMLADDDAENVRTAVQMQKLGTGSGSVSKTYTNDPGHAVLREAVVNRSAKTVTTTVDHPFSDLDAVQVTVNGLAVSSTSHTVPEPVLYRYDALGRPLQQVSPRTGLVESSVVYNSAGLASSATDGAGHETLYTYYSNSHASAGQLASRTNAEGETVRYAYDNLGRLTHQWGGGAYPLQYTYSAYGEMTELRTYRATGDWSSATLPTSFGSATPSLTSWAYKPGSGLLESKDDDSGRVVTYGYYNSGMLATRFTERGIVTTYGYDNANRLTNIGYSDSTPDVAHTYRRDGQRLTTTDAAGAHVYSYHEDVGALAGETVTGGVMDGLVLEWAMDAAKRPGGFSSELDSTPLTSVTYGYSAQSRLEVVEDTLHSATYGYTANSDLLHTTTLKTGESTQLVGTRLYDNASRLGSIGWVNASEQTLSSHVYTYDDAGRRTRADLADGSYWQYGYNDKGEVTGGVKRNNAATAYPGLSHGYTFDEIGNRLTATVDAAGGGSRTTVYTPNALNQYSEVGYPANFNVTGSAIESAVVKVNTQSTERLGRYFRKELSAPSQPSWSDVAVEVTLPGAGPGGGDIVTSQSGKRYVAPAADVPEYDDDGNLVSNSRWSYTWDGENRLIAMETTSTAAILGVPKRRLEFGYDGDSRRISKKVYDWDSGTTAWILSSSRRFVYDQWNLVVEVDGTGAMLARYVWGLDLSQTFQGAGGVGGLLWSEIQGSPATSHFAYYDGNGNLTGLVQADANAVSARYDYDAFGNGVLVETASGTVNNPFQFSTKYTDGETGLCYYGYRYYDAAKGRWINRDPIGEYGGVNLYGMLGNAPIGGVDYLGLSIVCNCPIDVLLKKYGISGYGVEKDAAGRYRYGSVIGFAGDALEGEDLERLIIVRMIKSKHPFELKDPDPIASLKAHVARRVQVVKNARGAKFRFPKTRDTKAPGNLAPHTGLSGVTGFYNHQSSPTPDMFSDPQGFYDSVNNEGTGVGCAAGGMICTGVDTGKREHHNIFIPGDSLFIRNNGPNKDVSILEGQNLIHVGISGGSDQFWGLLPLGGQIQSGVNWLTLVEDFTGSSSKQLSLDPTVLYPQAGLEISK